jgi:N-acetylglutamate synthase-like GNAT family acetyltransferase
MSQQEVLVRPVRASDADAIARMHRRCSLETVYRRYLTAVPSLSPVLQRRLLDLHLTLVAEHGGEIVALAHLAVAPGQPTELAVLVEDAWQRRGIGARITEEAVRRAEADGMDTLVAYTLPSSAAVHALLRRLRRGALRPAFRRTDDGLVTVTMSLGPADSGVERLSA